MDAYASNLEKLREKQKAIKAQSALFWKPQVGENLIRILPALKKYGEDVFYFEYLAHYNIGNEGFICNATFGKDCLICKVAQKWEHKQGVWLSAASDIAAVERYLVRMYEVNDPQSGIKFWNIPKGLLSDLISIYIDPDYENFTHPREGRNLVLHRTGEGKKTKYKLLPKPKTSPIDPSIIKLLKSGDYAYTRVVKHYKDEDVINALRELKTSLEEQSES